MRSPVLNTKPSVLHFESAYTGPQLVDDRRNLFFRPTGPDVLGTVDIPGLDPEHKYPLRPATIV